jgi:short-subunit dehydrogenase
VFLKAIIIGATSGIGRELAKQMSSDGYTVGITGRRTNLLDSLEEELDRKCFKSIMDLTDISESVRLFRELLERMECVDIVVVNSGVGYIDPKYPLTEELETVAINVAGFTAMANVAYRYFAKRSNGHIVGISSVSGIRGGPNVAYNASKTYVSAYLEGLSCRSCAQRDGVFVTDIRPGFVDTAMAKGDGIFWKAPVEKAANQIFNAIEKKRRIAYVTKRWWLIGLLFRFLPFWVYRKLIS